MNLHRILQISKGLPHDSLHDMLFARKLSASLTETVTVSGYPCVLENSVGKPVVDYRIYGNTVQNGTPIPDNPVEGQSVGDKTKNLFNKNGSILKGYHIGVDGSLIRNTRWRTTDYFIECSGVVSVSALYGLGSSAYIACYDMDKNYIGSILQTPNEELQVTATLPSGTAYIKTCLRDVNLDSYQIELGDTATTYEPYGYKIPVVVSGENHEPITTNIYLDEPLRKIGDYADMLDYNQNTIKRKIGKLIFTGDEAIRSTHLDRNLFMLDMKGYLRTLEITSLSSHYQTQANVTGYTSVADMRCTFYADPSALSSSLLYIRDSRFSTIADFKSYLTQQYDAGTPVTVYYALAKSRTENLTLPKLPTLNGTTIITTDTEIQPSDMEITYKARKSK